MMEIDRRGRERDGSREGKREKNLEEFFPNVRKRCMRVSLIRIPGGSKLAVVLFIRNNLIINF